MSDVKITWNKNSIITSVKESPSISIEPVKILLANPMVHIPKIIGTSNRCKRSIKNVLHLRRLNANAVPIPEIINNAASLH